MKLACNKLNISLPFPPTPAVEGIKSTDLIVGKTVKIRKRRKIEKSREKINSKMFKLRKKMRVIRI